MSSEKIGAGGAEGNAQILLERKRVKVSGEKEADQSGARRLERRGAKRAVRRERMAEKE